MVKQPQNTKIPTQKLVEMPQVHMPSIANTQRFDIYAVTKQNLFGIMFVLNTYFLCSAPLFGVLFQTFRYSLTFAVRFLVRLCFFVSVYSYSLFIVNFLKYENKENWKSKWKLVKNQEIDPQSLSLDDDKDISSTI